MSWTQKQEYMKWLGQYDWGWFGTFTFREGEQSSFSPLDRTIGGL